MSLNVYAADDYKYDSIGLDLFSKAAIIIDAESGKILYGKDIDQKLANASTTKIMTCIMVLENVNLEDEISASSYAASMPKVRLGVKCGDTFKVKDLLYSLMLESHNDSAVILAEYVGRLLLNNESMGIPIDCSKHNLEESKAAIGKFMELCNIKAKDLGCKKTLFLTPNGLDANNENGEHGTCCLDLVKIMKYCLYDSDMKETFLNITRTGNYSFYANSRNYSMSNHNALLQLYDNAISGKTGFTNKAGYCYVGAFDFKGRTLVFALLGCGWPPNKNWKWKDSKKLYNYVCDNFQEKSIQLKAEFNEMCILNGANINGNPFSKVYIEPKLDLNGQNLYSALMKKNEFLNVKVVLRDNIIAPIKKGEILGKEHIVVCGNSGDDILLTRNIVSGTDVNKITYEFCLKYVIFSYFNF